MRNAQVCSEIHRFPIVKNIYQNQRIVCSWFQEPLKNRPIQHFFHIFKSENHRFFFVLVFPIQTRNQRIPGSGYFMEFLQWAQGTGVISSRVCYPSLITAPTLGCVETFHLGTSIQFGGLDRIRDIWDLDRDSFPWWSPELIPGPVGLNAGPRYRRSSRAELYTSPAASPLSAWTPSSLTDLVNLYGRFWRVLAVHSLSSGEEKKKGRSSSCLDSLGDKSLKSRWKWAFYMHLNVFDSSTIFLVVVVMVVVLLLRALHLSISLVLCQQVFVGFV